jgi:hypothetical protein
MRRILFALPLLAATMTLAQAPVQAPRPFTLHHVYPLDQSQVYPLNRWNCPVGMTAEQKATGATQWIVSLEDSRNPSRIPPGKMGVHVALKAPGDWKFRSAKVEVAYVVPPAGMMLVDGNQSTETRTFDLSSSEDPTQELERSLLIGSGVSITRVKLLGLTYADGTVWQPGSMYSCSVRVSHFLPVATAP